MERRVARKRIGKGGKKGASETIGFELGIDRQIFICGGTC